MVDQNPADPALQLSPIGSQQTPADLLYLAIILSLLLVDGQVTSHLVSSYHLARPFPSLSQFLFLPSYSNMPAEKASLLTIPSELRNTIYTLVFDDPDLYNAPPAEPPRKSSGFATALGLQPPEPSHTRRRTNELDILLTCRKIYNEANLLALSLTPFNVPGDCTYPDLFDLRSRPLSATRIGAIKHITLRARISQLRALNEAWLSQPFGHPSLRLDTLVIVPSRPEVYGAAFAEIADLSQSHTLAYIFSETFKGLRNVKCVEVRNEGCFTEVVWKMVYRQLTYRLWRWGGGRCGVRFESGECAPGGTAECGNQWFKAWFDEEKGVECGEEVVRLVGDTGEFPDPNLAGMVT